MRWLIAVCFLLCSCASRELKDIYYVERDHYILIKKIDSDRQVFQYVLAKDIRVFEFPDRVELWRNEEKLDTIWNPTLVTTGPRVY